MLILKILTNPNDGCSFRMVALVATMRKLLVIAIGVLRNDKPFDPNWAKIQQEKYLLCT